MHFIDILKNIFRLRLNRKLILPIIIYFLISLAYTNVTSLSIRSNYPGITRLLFHEIFRFTFIHNFFSENKEDNINEFTLVKTYTIASEEIYPVISYSGIVEPEDTIEIYSKVSGRIENIFVQEGDEVKRGQLLAKLDSLTFDLDLLKYQVNYKTLLAQEELSRQKYNTARRNFDIKLSEIRKRKSILKKTSDELDRLQEIYDKKKNLFNQNAITLEEIKNIELELNNKKKSVTQAKLDLNMILVGMRESDLPENIDTKNFNSEQRIELFRNNLTKIEEAEYEVAKKNTEAAKVSIKTAEMLIKESYIRSPSNAVLAKRNKSLGELVSAGGSSAQSIFTLVSINNLFVSFHANESDILKLKKGQSVSIKSDIDPTSLFNSKIVMISPVIDDKTHTGLIRVKITNPSKRLKPGMFVRAEARIGDKKDIINIPTKALIPISELEGSVYLIKENTAYKIPVKIGDKKDENIEITEGLSDGDVIAISSISRLKDGSKVGIQN